jgi:hypothetical protein
MLQIHQFSERDAERSREFFLSDDGDCIRARSLEVLEVARMNARLPREFFLRKIVFPTQSLQLLAELETYVSFHTLYIAC